MLKKIFIWMVFPTFLIFLGVGLSVLKIYRDEISLLTLTYGFSRNQLISWKDGELYAGEKIVGEFIAKENYLGIVAVRFDNFAHINDDYVIFRLKEKGNKSWYYQNRYKVDQFQPGQLFPFGFPIIKDSVNKKYIFEVESVKGEPGNAIRIDLTNPVFITRYKFPKEVVFREDDFTSKKVVSLKNEDVSKFVFQAPKFILKKITSLRYEEAQKFILKKFINLFDNLNFSYLLIFYFIPFVTYLYWLLVYRKVKRKIFILTLFPLLISILALFLASPFDDFIYVESIVYWIFFVVYYKLDSSLMFALSVIMLLGCPLFQYLGRSVLSEKFGVWAFIFLSLGVMDIFLENKFPNKEKVNFVKLFTKIAKEIKFFK